MRHFLYIVVLAIMVPVACGKTTPGQPLPVVDPAPLYESIPWHPLPDAPFLQWIPSDAAIVIVGVERMPRSFRDRIVAWIEPVARAVEALDQAALGEMPLVSRVIVAELKGRLSQTGLLELGIDTDPRFALYNIGPALALRVELASQERFLAAVGRVERAVGEHLPRARLDDVEYVSIVDSDLQLAVAVRDSQLVAGLMLQQDASTVLPVLLGLERPERTLADDVGVLRGIASTYQLRGYALGYVDTPRVVELGLSRGAELGIGAACRDELMAVASAIPRIVAGCRHLDGEHSTSILAVELEPALATMAARVTRPVPGWGLFHHRKDLPAVVGMGIDVDELVAWLHTLVNSSPGEAQASCSITGPGRELVQAVTSFLHRKGLHGLQGATAAIAGAQVDPAGALAKVAGIALVRADNVAAVLGALGSLWPPLRNLTVEANGKPVSVPEQVDFLPPTYVAATGQHLVLTAQDEGADRVAMAVLQSDLARPGPFFAVKVNQAGNFTFSFSLIDFDISYNIGNQPVDFDESAFDSDDLLEVYATDRGVVLRTTQRFRGED